MPSFYVCFNLFSNISIWLSITFNIFHRSYNAVEEHAYSLESVKDLESNNEHSIGIAKDLDHDSSLCENLPDDILTMSRGIDITKLDLFPNTAEGLRKNPGFARQVIQLTCKYHYFKRDLNNKPLVMLPDQVQPTSYEIRSGMH